MKMGTIRSPRRYDGASEPATNLASAADAYRKRYDDDIDPA
jgi:hypothetical protein